MRELHLEIEVFGQQQVAQVLELRQQLADLGLRLVELGFLQELLGFLHLVQDQLLARELEGQSKPRGVLRLQAAQRLGEPEHPLFQLGHLGGDVLLGEPDRVAVGGGFGFALAVASAALVAASAGFLSSSSKTPAALSCAGIAFVT